MRHRVGTTVAGTAAIDLARSAAGTDEHTSPNARLSAAPCAARCDTAEPGQRGERPPRSGRASTGALARRPAASAGGRSPLRPGGVLLRVSVPHSQSHSARSMRSLLKCYGRAQPGQGFARSARRCATLTWLPRARWWATTERTEDRVSDDSSIPDRDQRAIRVGHRTVSTACPSDVTRRIENRSPSTQTGKNGL